MATLELPFNSLVIESLQLQYRSVLDAVYRRASINQPRGMKVYDAGYTVLKITQPMMPQLPVKTGRGVNLDIAAIEALQLVAGCPAHDLVLKIAPQFERYANADDDGNLKFHGNYGSRVRADVFHDCGTDEWHSSWVECAVYKIKMDRDTRQAVVTIWDNRLDAARRPMNDFPCTIALGFRIFRNRLDMHVTMRSSDAWLGLPLDVFQFTQAQWTVASMLSVPMGDFYLNAWSMHLYEQDTPKIGDVRDRSYLADTVLPQGFKDVTNAGFILSGAVRDYSASERWYVDRLAPYVNDEDETEEKK